jgi:hypothetical protein
MQNITSGKGPLKFNGKLLLDESSYILRLCGD